MLPSPLVVRAGVEEAGCGVCSTDVTAEALEQMRCLRLGVGRWANQKISSAWNKWYERYLDTLDFLHGERERESAAGRALRHWLNRAMSQAMNQWRSVYAEFKHQQMLLKRGLMRMILHFIILCPIVDQERRHLQYTIPTMNSK